MNTLNDPTIESLHQIELSAARKVQAERAGAGDVWPAGWSAAQIQSFRELGELFLRDNPQWENP